MSMIGPACCINQSSIIGPRSKVNTSNMIGPGCYLNPEKYLIRMQDGGE